MQVSSHYDFSGNLREEYEFEMLISVSVSSEVNTRIPKDIAAN